MSPLSELSTSRNKQRTLAKSVSFSGIGLFTGEKVNVTFVPEVENSGIVFQRVDLPNKPVLPAKVEYVRSTPRCTIIGNEVFSIQTVEHVLAALKAYGIDNLTIELDGPEIPSFDGSAAPFVELIEKAGIFAQSLPKEIYCLSSPVFWSKGEVHLVALPSDEFRISYTLHYPHSEFLKSQFYTLAINGENFKKEIAPARTFALYEEIVSLIEKGGIKGGSLENAVVIKGGSILNPEGIRFEEEMARHKILDLIGDLSLVGRNFLAHIIAIRSGHFSNTSLAKELENSIIREKLNVSSNT